MVTLARQPPLNQRFNISMKKNKTDSYNYTRGVPSKIIGFNSTQKGGAS